MKNLIFLFLFAIATVWCLEEPQNKTTAWIHYDEYEEELPLSTYEISTDLSFDVETSPGCDWDYQAYYLMTYPSIGNLIIPYIWDKKAYIHCPDIGDIYVEDNIVETVTRHKIEQFSIKDTPQRSPTLFISIGGANFFSDPDGNRIHDWQKPGYIEKEIAIFMSQAKAEFYYMMVDWNSLRPNQKQARRLAKIVQTFLNGRTQRWDVVIIGHSRGGIFVHELSEELSDHRHRNQGKLYAFLIDPTAVPALGDIFPIRKPSRVTLSKNYYDDRRLIDIDTEGTIFRVVDDRTISGYDVNQIYQLERRPQTDLESHSNIIYDYVRRQFTIDLQEVLDRKDPPRDYDKEGCGSEVVRIGDSKSLVSGDLEFDFSNGFHMEGSIGIERAQASVDVRADNSGLSAAVASAIVAGAISFNEEGVAAYASVTGVGSFGAVVNEEGIDVGYEGFGHSAQAVISEEEVAITVSAGENSVVVSDSGGAIEIAGVTIARW